MKIISVLRRYQGLMAFLWLYSFVSAQEIHLSFTHLSTTNGLLSNQVNSVTQDDQGFIWIGSIDGIQRYDGYRFVSFRHQPDNPLSIPSNPVSQLLLDNQARLWVLLEDGRAGIFDTRKFVFREAVVIADPDNTYPALAKELYTDSWGNVFLLHKRKELYRWDEEKHEFRIIRFRSDQKEHLRIESLAQQKGTGDYWISFYGKGLFRYYTIQGQWNHPGNFLEENPVAQLQYVKTPYNLYCDQKGRLWFQSWPGVTPLIGCFDLVTLQLVMKDFALHDQIQSYLETHRFFETRDSTIWVGGVNVFARYHEADCQFEVVHNGYTSDRSISFGSVTSLHEDHQQNIWVGTNNNGVFRFNPDEEYFTNISHINRLKQRRGLGSPTSYMPLNDQTTLVAYWGDGLYRYDSLWNEIPLHIKGISDDNELSIWSMYRSLRDNTIWMSTQPAGIWQFNEALGEIHPKETSLLPQNTIRQIAEDKKGNLWLGMHGVGVYRWNAQKGKIRFGDGLEKYNIIPRTNVNKITIDAHGIVWIATSSAGAYAIDPETDRVITYLHKDAKKPGLQLPEEGCASILEYNDSLMVIATSRSLHLFNRQRETLSDFMHSGLMSGYLTAMEKDRQGYLWVTTTSGLYRVSMNNKIILRFNRQDGLEDEVFTLASSCQLPDGRLVFGASEKFIAFDPGSIRFNTEQIPEVTISAIRVDNQAILVDSLLRRDGIELRYKENALEFEFSTLQFTNPYPVFYKMEGLDEDWRRATTHTAVYSYLPPGNYRLLLKAEDTEGKEGNIREIPVSVTPPFWKAWWFYSILFLGVMTILYFFDKERIRRKEAIHQMRTGIANNLHNEIHVALNNINILSEMARLKAGKDPAKAMEYLEQINAKSQDMMHSMDDILWTVAPENDSMIRIVERMEEYVEKLRSRDQADIDLLIDDKVVTLSLDMRIRQIILRLFKNLVDNLLKTGGDHCHIHLGWEKNNLDFDIEFDTTRTDLQELNNLLFRQDLKTLMEEIHAELKMKTLSSKALIQVKIPLD